MKKDEIIKLIQSANIFPIPVEAVNDTRKMHPDMDFSGSIEKFFEAVKALNIPAIFLLTETLGDEYFVYDPEPSVDDECVDIQSEANEVSTELEQVDLTAYLPSFAYYKKYIGQERGTVLIAKSNIVSLGFLVTAPWWEAFQEQRSAAIAKVDAEIEARREKTACLREEEDVARERVEDELISKVRCLLDDRDFCKIPTQRGMMAYALENLPELEEVDEDRLKQEIQKLSDRIKARRRK